MKKSQTYLLLVLAVPSAAFAGMSPAENAPQPIQSTSQGDWMTGIGIGGQIGTQGVGLHLTYNINPSLYFGLDGNYFDYSRKFNLKGEDYDGRLDYSNIGFTANYLPIADSGFRITGGTFFGRNIFRGLYKGAGKTGTFNGNKYALNAGDDIHSEITSATFNPYLGLGWDWALGTDHNIVVGLDLGVSYLGEPDVKFTGKGQFSSGQAATDIAAEQDKIQNDISAYKFYPVAKISVTYHF